jgi:hypothetical protein
MTMVADTWTAMRGNTWDMYDGDQPESRLSVLLGVLGGTGKPIAWQQHLLRGWLACGAARPAPEKLVKEAHKFLEVSSE